MPTTTTNHVNTGPIVALTEVMGFLGGYFLQWVGKIFSRRWSETSRGTCCVVAIGIALEKCAPPELTQVRFVKSHGAGKTPE